MHPTQQPAPAQVDTDPTPADTLRNAARYLARHGWTQGRYYADLPILTPPACALGAIAMACYGSPVADPYSFEWPEHSDFTSAVTMLTDYLDVNSHNDDLDDYDWFTRSDGPDVHDWNDDTNRTVTQVIVALNAAADDWDQTHGGAK